jgi:hypothetical protein
MVGHWYNNWCWQWSRWRRRRRRRAEVVLLQKRGEARDVQRAFVADSGPGAGQVRSVRREATHW